MEPLIPQANWDKLVADVVELKANQEGIKKKLNLVFQFKKKVDLILEILTKKEQGKNDNNSETSDSNDFLYPSSYQFLVECTLPQSNDSLSLMPELKPGCHEVPPAEVEHIQFKKKKIGNIGYKEYTNLLGKQFKVNDPYEVDPLRPYDKNQLRSFNKWLESIVDNSMPIKFGVGSGDVSWFLDLKTPGKWTDGKVRIYINAFKL